MDVGCWIILSSPAWKKSTGTTCTNDYNILRSLDTTFESYCFVHHCLVVQTLTGFRDHSCSACLTVLEATLNMFSWADCSIYTNVNMVRNLIKLRSVKVLLIKVYQKRLSWIQLPHDVSVYVLVLIIQVLFVNGLLGCDGTSKQNCFVLKTIKLCSGIKLCTSSCIWTSFPPKLIEVQNWS